MCNDWCLVERAELLISAKKSTVDYSMNKEEKKKQLEQIRRIEGLLAYAIQHNEIEEIERLRKALDAIIANL